MVSQKNSRPVWKKALRNVAVIILAISLALGTLISTNPYVRAAAIHWVMEWYDTHIFYRHSGELISTELPQYKIASLPEGYVEIDRLVWPGYVSVTYQNENGLPLYLDYSFMQQGSAIDFVTDNMEVSPIKGLLSIPESWIMKETKC